MEVVGPHGVDPVGGDQQRLVQVALGHHHRARAGRVHPRRQLLQDVDRAAVVEGLDGVQTQAVDAVVGDPLLGVVEHEAAHEVRAGPVQVDRRPPVGGDVAEVGAELGQVVPLGAEVVVDDVEDHGQPRLVAGVDEAAEAGRPAVGGVDGVEVDPVVAPAPRPGEGGHRHDLDRVDPEAGQVAEPPDGRVEGPLGGEGAAVQLVEDQVLEGRDGGRSRRPAQVDQPRRAVDPVGLEPRARVGPLPLAVEDQQIVVAGGRPLDAHTPDAPVLALHRHRPAADPHGQRAHPGRPHPELGAPLEQPGPQGHSGASHTVASGGNVTRPEAGWPSHSIASASTTPMLPTLVPL